MRGFVFSVVLILAVSVVSLPSYKELFYNQTLDHFNFETRPATFPMRYLVVDQFWKKGGPIFFYTGNEGDIVSFMENTGFMFDIAPEFGALLVFAEHRYYGKSMPFGDDSFSRQHVGYLSIEQALADFAELIRWIKETHEVNDTPVIAFGGSYGGMLTAWMRIKYPDVVDGGIAASAPLKMVYGETEGTAFFEHVTNDFHAAHPDCPNIVRAGFVRLLELAEQGESGYAQLQQELRLCEAVTADNIEDLKLWAVNGFVNLAMMDYPQPTSFLAPLPAFPVKVSCDMMRAAESPLAALSAGTGLFYNGTTGLLKCFNISDEFKFCADQTGCGNGFGGFAWDYQVCTEVTYPTIANNKTDMFPPRAWTYADFDEYCETTWGVKPRTKWAALNFLGSDLARDGVTNIVFSNGNLDPWTAGGYIESMSSSVVAVLIENGAHHLDLRSAQPDDPESVIRARQLEVAHIKKWIAEATR